MFELWTEAVRSIEPLVKPAHRDRWLRPIECVGIDGDRIRLRAPNRYHKEWFEDNFLSSILGDIEARTQRSFTVEFEIAEGDGPPQHKQSDRRGDGAREVSAGAARAQIPTPVSVRKPDLVDRYTFDKFVVGP
ncbi:MAG TPA: DnaA N-terminal domain-containing protein, partial [Polyangia bacterium]